MPGFGTFTVSLVSLSVHQLFGPCGCTIATGMTTLEPFCTVQVVDGTWHGSGRPAFCPFQASAFALAALGAGYAFTIAGGHTGRLLLPDDIVPLTAQLRGRQPPFPFGKGLNGNHRRR